MEVRASRGRGGSWRRGGRGGHDSDSFGGEHRGRGRGGHHRGRGKRDNHRGRGRGRGAHTPEFNYRDQDEGDNFQEEEDDRKEVFSRRKLESNWDRYEESERREPGAADDTPTQRGTDYHVLLESAGDSFTQFRLSEEKDWEMDSFTANQMSVVFVDLPALALSLQQVPLHQRLNLEAELIQVSTPLELPAMSSAPKQEVARTSAFTPLSAPSKGPSTHQNVPVAAGPRVSSNAAEPPGDADGDEELDQLLSLEKPVTGALGNQSAGVTDERPEKACEEVEEVVSEAAGEKMEEVKDEDVTPPKAAPVKQEMTEEDLEDWLDSMIS